MADRLTLAVGAVAVGGATYLRVVDPHQPASYLPPCPTKHVTGLDCPGCGGMRMVADLLHADLRRAAEDNLFLLLISPLLAGLILRWARARRRGEDPRLPARLGVALGGAAGTWMVVRNLPFWPLRPA